MTSPVVETSSNVPAARTFPPSIRGIRAAFVFLTRVPVGGFPYRAEDWKWAAAHAPLVGAAVGAVAGIAARLLHPVGDTPAAVLAVGISMLVTGAFHEDGLADTSDALGGASDPTRVFAILKDSRVGTFGAAALVVSVVARATLAAALGASAPYGFVIAGAVARVAPIWLMATLPYVTDEASSKSRAVLRGGWAQAFVAGAWGALVLGAFVAAGRLSFVRALVVTAAVTAAGVLTGWRYRRRVGGITGDFLGATEQIGEIVVLAVLAYGSAASV